LTGWAGLATEKVDVGEAGEPPELVDLEQASRKAASVGKAAAVAAPLARNARRLSPRGYRRFADTVGSSRSVRCGEEGLVLVDRLERRIN